MEGCESWKLNHVLSPYLRGLFLSVGAGLEAQRSIYVQLFLGAGDKLNPGSVFVTLPPGTFKTLSTSPRNTLLGGEMRLRQTP